MANQFPDHTLANLAMIEELYALYAADPQSVDETWRHFFEGMDFGGFLQHHGTEKKEFSGCSELRIFKLIRAYRRYGHLQASFNPLKMNPESVAELQLEQLGFSQEELKAEFPSLGLCKEKMAPLSEIIKALSEIYCSRIGFEFMAIDRTDLRKGIQEMIEPRLAIEASIEEKKLILNGLNKSEVLERYLHTKYVGQKRFSLEGVETIIPMLAELIEEGIAGGIDDFFIGMAHRGRLNVLANILGKPYSLIFKEFEDTFYPLSLTDGSGDVKYHKGFSSEISGRSKKSAMLHLAPNASHLESVDAIVLGQTRANQVKKGDQLQSATSVILHGDAAFAGQGVVYETMQLAGLNGYATGGTIHIILNNQIGFTTLPEEAHSMRYCTDLAKAFNAPIFHVNAEDPESCIYAAKLAIRIRQKYHCDVILDLNGYRKYGHNEGDEPAFTQPLHYKVIRAKSSIRELYFQQLLKHGQLEKEMAETLEEEFKATLSNEQELAKESAETATDPQEAFGKAWRAPPEGATLLDPVETAVQAETLHQVLERFAAVPADFHLHPKLQKWLDDRKKMMINDAIDWGLGECLAFGSLLVEKTPVRLAGQDVKRGTFSHRHVMWVDQEDAHTHYSLEHLQEGQGRFDAVNSPLSEYAALGFEYGYSWVMPEGLVIWEAQYGDFVNTAQVMIDQYISAAEQKWMRYSSLVMLLPHGMEGQGPEHSSAKLERFLQLSSNENMQIVNATSSAQFFHVLRRQVKRALKKPLIVFTPKSHLRSAQTLSPLSAFTQGSFQEILDDPEPPTKASKILICSGRVYFDLVEERKKRNREDVVLLRLEQLFPLHTEKLKELLKKYSSASKVVWVQEEPMNMGAWDYIHPLLEQNLSEKQTVEFAGRRRSASPATGSHRQHVKELHDFLEEAFQ